MKTTPSSPWLSLLSPLSYYGFFAFFVLFFVLVVSFASELHRTHSLDQAWWWAVAHDPTLAIATFIIFLGSLWQAPRALQTTRRACKLGVHYLNNLIYWANGVPTYKLPKPPTK
jgi:hypothetical protein